MCFPTALVVSIALSAQPLSDVSVPAMSHAQVRPGQQFEIATGAGRLRGEFVNPKTGECVATASEAGGTFGPQQRVWLLGATQGSQSGARGLKLTLMHQVRVGMKMELGMGDLSPENRVITQPVTSINLLSRSVAASQQTAVR